MKSFAKILLPSSLAAADVGPTNRQPVRLEDVDDSRRQRRFWTNESKLDTIRLRKLDQLRMIIDGDAYELGHLAYSGVTRRTEKFDRSRPLYYAWTTGWRAHAHLSQ